MAVQQLMGFEVNAGGRDALLAALSEVKANIEAAGATARAFGISAGTSTGRIVASATHADWEAFAAYADATAANPTGRPLQDVLRSADPPATVVGSLIRNELLEREDASESGSFISSISFDVTGNRPEVIAAVSETRDWFEALGGSARIWTLANGENTGRITVTNEFDGIAGWARFRAKLDEHVAAGNPFPMSRVADSYQNAGILQSNEIAL